MLGCLLSLSTSTSSDACVTLALSSLIFFACTSRWSTANSPFDDADADGMHALQSVDALLLPICGSAMAETASSLGFAID
jgi:hypothetical protein